MLGSNIHTSIHQQTLDDSQLYFPQCTPLLLSPAGLSSWR